MKPRPSETILLANIQSQVSDAEILHHYLGINKIPVVINSPLRQDNNPSFSLYTKDGKTIQYMDFATRDSGSIYTLLKKLWGCSFRDCVYRIYHDMCVLKEQKVNMDISISSNIKTISQHKSDIKIDVKVREWRNYDIDYWKSYGVSLSLLKYAEVYPISHKIISKNNTKYVFGADKYAYVYIERKEGKITKKIYQPFNTQGYKWCNDNDSSVIGLWSKLPQAGDKVCICSSLKDALCLWNNMKIPSVYLQGEGYTMSDTAINELKKRFKNVYICFDSDKAGIEDAHKLSQATGFINAVLPEFKDMKDISDMYKGIPKKEWLSIMNRLFNDEQPDFSDLPFY